MQEGLPYPTADRIRISSVLLATRLSFEAHVGGRLCQPKIRVGVVSELVGRKWGAEKGIMRLSGESLAISILLYDLVF